MTCAAAWRFRAAESGHATVEAFLETIARAEVASVYEDLGGPESITVRSEEQLGKLLERRLADPQDADIEVPPDFWRQAKERARVNALRKGTHRVRA